MEHPAWNRLLESRRMNIEQARMGADRLPQTVHWTHEAKGHSSVGSIIVEAGNLMKISSNYMVPELSFDHSFNTIIPSGEG